VQDKIEFELSKILRHHRLKFNVATKTKSYHSFLLLYKLLKFLSSQALLVGLSLSFSNLITKVSFSVLLIHSLVKKGALSI
jgi:hypothetical protein